MRLDKYLTGCRPALSRTRVQALIAGGFVQVNGEIVRKASFAVTEGVDTVICTGAPDEAAYVSRGGLKLEAALDGFGVDVTGRKACDIGASTGGFTDCLLRRGARMVYAVDVGHGQLHPSLRENARVRSLEGCNARTLTPAETEGLCELAVTDVSFISQLYILPAASGILTDGGMYIGLIKPQFEAGRQWVGRGGIVRDREAHLLAVMRVVAGAQENGLCCTGLLRSPVPGGDGNTEFLMLCVKSHERTAFDRAGMEELIGP